MIERSTQILNSVFGYESFLPLQEKVISNALSGNSSLVLLPTGGGKSLCYQIPALQMEGICIVISPLVALIKDQVAQLKKRDIKAIGITGAVRIKDLDDMLDNAIHAIDENGKNIYKFLYMSPERLQHPLVQQRIKLMNVNLIAVDEAHCISEWGHDFRPSYRHIATVATLKPDAPIMALTATATIQVQQDIVNNLEIPAAVVFKNSFKRENITYRILDTPDKRVAVASFYKKYNGSSIAYVRSRKNCLEYAHYLQQHQIKSNYYHGGLDTKSRDSSMNEWMENKKQVMVATNAFGMGIDKPDVRTIVHLQLPDSIESYYQETGRSGRDGAASIAQFIYNINDLNHAHNQFIKALPTVDFVKKIYRALCNHLQIALHEGMETQYQFSFSEFCKHYNFNALSCYNALQILDRYDVLKMQQSGERLSSIRFRESANTIIHHTKNNQVSGSVMQAILRTYSGSQQQDIHINLGLIAMRSNTTESQVIEVLEKMIQLEVIDGQLAKADTQVFFLVPRENDRTINRFAGLLKRQNEIKKNKLDAMMQLVQERDLCLQNFILTYFNETPGKPCGACSNCSPRKKSEGLTNHQMVLDVLATPLNLMELQGKLGIDQTELTRIIRSFLEQKTIKITPDNKYQINE
ncbi:ATP-dependent DNA helicase RecQ [Nonlabens sp. Hel1_33_55]|uniref:RecQ family ATP-dependent DNA helicase n=1 Tax=Nonlabens sp. Hel1_33_55 TaxID=1336802 RepID=UPI000875E5F3|nr:RecQ family ATP-dependent DNA helicase [Nonlabens sp. Hel1_33_55]SCY01153.1 ATP-dependent DNA helicase RecQ [Nonlabens sp. Hel1_33_55]